MLHCPIAKQVFWMTALYACYMESLYIQFTHKTYHSLIFGHSSDGCLQSFHSFPHNHNQYSCTVHLSHNLSISKGCYYIYIYIYIVIILLHLSMFAMIVRNYMMQTVGHQRDTLKALSWYIDILNIGVVIRWWHSNLWSCHILSLPKRDPGIYSPGQGQLHRMHLQDSSCLRSMHRSCLSVPLYTYLGESKLHWRALPRVEISYLPADYSGKYINPCDIKSTANENILKIWK